MRRLGRFLAAAGLAVAGGLALPSGAAQAAACSGTTGVTVVVDFGSSTTVACTAGDPGSGLQALSMAGFGYQLVANQAFVCKINGYPASQTCQRTPPSTAYWSYWHASRGGSWQYSSSGAGNYNPPAGSVEGWSFGGGSAPSTPPPAAPAPKPSPTPSPSPTSSRPRSTGTSPSSPRPTSSPRPRTSTAVPPTGTAATAPATRTATGSTTTRPTTATTTGTPSTTTDEPTPTGGASGETAASAATQPSSGAGSPTTLLAGVGLVTLVGAAAAYLALRRRRETS